MVICESVVPGVKQVGLKFGRGSGGGVDVDFGGSVTTTAANSEALHTFLECLKEQNSHKAVTITRGVDLTLEPIGQVADHWKGDDDLRLMLMPGGDESILNNL
jgi:hypothetical protein